MECKQIRGRIAQRLYSRYLAWSCCSLSWWLLEPWNLQCHTSLWWTHLSWAYMRSRSRRSVLSDIPNCYWGKCSYVLSHNERFQPYEHRISRKLFAWKYDEPMSLVAYQCHERLGNWLDHLPFDTWSPGMSSPSPEILQWICWYESCARRDWALQLHWAGSIRPWRCSWWSLSTSRRQVLQRCDAEQPRRDYCNFGWSLSWICTGPMDFKILAHDRWPVACFCAKCYSLRRSYGSYFLASLSWSGTNTTFSW